jgi:Cep192 domain 4
VLIHRRLITGVAFAMAAPLLALAPTAAQASATSLDWTQVSTTGPAPRESAYMAYDSGRSKTVLFGGAEPAGTGKFDADTWEFDGTTWTQIPVSGPPAGALGVMAYDSRRGVSVLFGGGDATTFLPPVTWEWNGATWSPRFTQHAPPARVWTAMSYDSLRHVMVLFGGAGNQGLTFGDTWEYDGIDWRQVLTAHSPPARYGDGLAFDPVRGKTVLFGGHTDTGRVNDTWEYNGSDWTQIAAGNPPAVRFWHSMAYDAALGGVVVFGGDYFVPFITLGPNNETWLYDGTVWQQLQLTDNPSPRAMAPMVYDSAHSYLVLFGGSLETSPDTALGDTWTLGGPLPNAVLSVSSIQFPQEPVLSTTTQSVTLSNTGTAPLFLTGVAAGGDFSSTDNCPRSPVGLAPNATCIITVAFTPSTGNGTINGTLTITDNAGTGSQSIPLSGSGQWGEINPLATSVDFGTSPINPAGPTAIGTEAFTMPDFPTIVLSVSAGAPFVVTNFDCPVGVLLPVGTTCHIQMAFQPATAGAYSQSLIIRANQANLQLVTLTGTATTVPTSINLTLNSIGATVPTFGGAVAVVASTSAGSGSATFTFNGQQIGAPQPINASGTATQTIQLNASTIAAGAGTYPLVVAIHPTDGVHADNSVTQPVTVVPAGVQLAWNGTGEAVAGTQAMLSVTLTTPAGQPQVDFASVPVWVRFDVTDGFGTVTTYYAQVSPSGAASVTGASLSPGAYGVRARLVSSLPSDMPNAYVHTDDLRTAFAAQPTRGGFIAGTAQQGSQAVAFEFAPGSKPTGSLVWITKVQVTGPDGQQHDAYRVIVSTSVTSVVSHSHAATASGTASVTVVDAATGARYSAFDQTTTFQVNIASNGSVSLSAGGYAASLPAGTGINNL